MIGWSWPILDGMSFVLFLCFSVGSVFLAVGFLGAKFIFLCLEISRNFDWILATQFLGVFSSGFFFKRALSRYNFYTQSVLNRNWLILPSRIPRWLGSSTISFQTIIGIRCRPAFCTFGLARLPLGLLGAPSILLSLASHVIRVRSISIMSYIILSSSLPFFGVKIKFVI